MFFRMTVLLGKHDTEAYRESFKGNSIVTLGINKLGIFTSIYPLK